MDDIKVSLDEEQLTRVIKLNEKSQVPFWKTDRFIQLVQMAAIVLSGVWILIQFFDYGREAAHVSLRRDELAADIAQLTLSTQKEQTQLRQSELEHSVQLKKLDIELKQLDREIDRLNLVSSTTRKIDYEYGLEIKKLKEFPESDISQYVANLSFKVKNTSKLDLSTDFIVIDAFVRKLSVGKEENEIATIEPVGVAPDFFYSEIKPESGFKIDEWHWIMRQSFVSPSIPMSAQKQLEQRFVKVADITPGGSGVGTWKSNESVSVGKEYIVVGQKGDYVSFVINICFNGCTKGSDRWWFPYTILLPSD